MRNIVVIPEVDETLVKALQNHLCSRTQDIHMLLKEFHNVYIKNVTAKPRTVYWSDELKKHLLYKRGKKQVIEKIVSNIKRGESINQYLSEKSDQLNHYDLSLSHFGVHHLHLGESIQARGSRAGKVKGTKCLLFIRFTETDAYLLDILGHGMRSGFLNMHIVRVMYKNWPKSVEPYRIKSAVGVAVKYTDEEAAELIENNVNVIVEIAPEKVFMLPGMGTTTAGIPLVVERRVDKTIRELRAIVQIVKENSCATATLIRKLTGTWCNVIRLRGRIRAGLLYIYDTGSGCIFTLQDNHLVVSVPDEF